MGKVLGVDHVSILVEDAERSLQFYQSVLALPLLKRPELGFPGYWLGLGAGQSLHIMELPNPRALSPTQLPAHGGRDTHFALRVDSIQGFLERLDAKGLEYTASRSGRPAVFVRDPDGNAFELFERALATTSHH